VATKSRCKQLLGNVFSLDETKIAEESQADERQVVKLYLDVIGHLADRLEYIQLRRTHPGDVPNYVTAKQTQTHANAHHNLYYSL